MSVQRLRTGEQFLSDLRTRPRTVYVDGERVTNVAEGGHTADIFQRESSGESPETPKDGLLGGRQEVVAPVDCRSKRLMTR